MHNLNNNKKNNVIVTAATLVMVVTILVFATTTMAPLTALGSRSGGGEFIDPLTLRKTPAVVSGDNIYIAW
jgi:hypothetical protein